MTEISLNESFAGAEEAGSTSLQQMTQIKALKFNSYLNVYELIISYSKRITEEWKHMDKTSANKEGQGA